MSTSRYSDAVMRTIVANGSSEDANGLSRKDPGTAS
jgi:hypothetical protein